MPFQPLNLYKTRNEIVAGEGVEVELKSKEQKSKVYTYHAYNRPVLGYIIGICPAIIYPNARIHQFVYAKFGSNYGWVSLETTEIVGVKIERDKLGGYRFIWGDSRKEETEQINAVEKTGIKTETKSTKRKSKTRSKELG